MPQFFPVWLIAHRQDNTFSMSFNPPTTLPHSNDDNNADVFHDDGKTLMHIFHSGKTS